VCGGCGNRPRCGDVGAVVDAGALLALRDVKHGAQASARSFLGVRRIAGNGNRGQYAVYHHRNHQLDRSQSNLRFMTPSPSSSCDLLPVASPELAGHAPGIADRAAVPSHLAAIRQCADEKKAGLPLLFRAANQNYLVAAAFTSALPSALTAAVSALAAVLSAAALTLVLVSAASDLAFALADLAWRFALAFAALA
jgi:hypothetical protein